MLEDFVEGNSIPAEFIPKRISVNAAKCLLLMPKSPAEKPVLAVFPAGTRVSVEKAETETGLTLKPAVEKETFNVTGYEAEYLPPLSVYGVIVLVEDSLMEKNALHFLVGEEKTLRVSPTEIIDFNEESKPCRII